MMLPNTIFDSSLTVPSIQSKLVNSAIQRGLDPALWLAPGNAGTNQVYIEWRGCACQFWTRMRLLNHIHDVKKITSGKFLVQLGTAAIILIFASASNASSINPKDIDRFSDVGLGKPQKILQLADALCEIKYDDSPIVLSAGLNEVLANILKSTMPAPSVVFDNSIPGVGYFSHRTWTIKISNNLSSKNKLTRLLQILMHELRHAEQRFIAARYQAAIGTTKEDKSAYVNLPDSIISHALNNPSIPESDEYEFGQFVSREMLDEAIENKKQYLLDKLTNAKKGSREYKDYFDRYMLELPRERDAKTFDRALRQSIEECSKKRE